MEGCDALLFCVGGNLGIFLGCVCVGVCCVWLFEFAVGVVFVADHADNLL